MEKKEKKQKSKGLIIILLGLFVANAVLAGLLVKSLSQIRQLEAQFAEMAVEEEELVEDIQTMLPETVYAVSGVTMEIYNSQVTSLEEEITKYNVRWNCEVGENLERKFSVVADENNIGSYDLTLEIYNNDLQLVAEKNCVLKIIEEDVQKKEAVKAIEDISKVPAECLEQVKISVDTKYNGALDALKPEGVAQMQDVVYSVLSGI